jgi:hypothetical protein
MKRDVVAPVRKVYPPFVWRAKIPIPAAPMNRDLRQATGYYGIYAEILRISTPHFRNKKDLYP